MVFANTVLGLMIGLAIMSDIDTASKLVAVLATLYFIYYFNYSEDFSDEKN